MTTCFFLLLARVPWFPLWVVGSLSIPPPNPVPPPRISHRLLIVGLGRVGKELAQRMAVTKQDDTTWDVFGAVRNISAAVCSSGVVDCQLLQDAVPTNCSHILLTLPATTTGSRRHTDDETTTRQSLAVLQQQSTVSWLGVISTTGVYGNHNGAWVTENDDDDHENATQGSIEWLEWERYWSSAAATTVRIFRCTGIYGHGQSALHAVYQHGLEMLVPSESDSLVTNRIHVDDVVSAILASINDTRPGVRIYNLADNFPESRSIVMKYAADLLNKHGIRRSPLQPGDLTGPRTTSNRRSLRRQSQTKRVSNQRMRDELLPTLAFPTYREGLQAILNDPNAPWNSA